MLNLSFEQVMQYAKDYKAVPVAKECLADMLTPLAFLDNVRRSSRNYFLLESIEGGEHWARYSFVGYDPVLRLKITDGNAEIIIAGSNGKAVRFNETTVRSMSRIARGVKGFNTDGGEVIGLATNEQGKYILTVSSNGYGKKSLLEDFRLTNRGNMGVKAITITEKTGDLVALRAVNGDEDLMIMSDGGIIIRISLTQVGVYSRAAQGVKVINLSEDQIVSSVAVVAPDGETEEISEDNPVVTEEEQKQILLD